MAIQPVERPRQFAKSFAVINTLMMALLATITFGVLLFFRLPVVTSSVLPSISEPPDDLMPGHALPNHTMCYYSPPGSDSISCHVVLGEQTYYLAYNFKRRIIVHTSVAVENATVGQLILKWGQPTGIKRARWLNQVEWGHRSVYVSASPFAPINKILFVSYNLEPEPAAPWTGFTNDEKAFAQG